MFRITLSAVLCVLSLSFSQDIMESESGSDSSAVSLMNTGYLSQKNDPEYTNEQLQSKYASFTRMNNAGRTCFVGGMICLGIGAAGISSGIPLIIDNIFYGVPLLFVGEIGFTFGMPMTVAGAVLRKIGRKKMGEYKERLDRVSLIISPKSISVVYLF